VTETVPPFDGWTNWPRDHRIFVSSAEPADLAQQVADLRVMMLRLIQEVAVLEEMLEVKAVWNRDLYKDLSIKRMVGDHNSSVAAFPRGRSYYPYTLDEDDFLRERLSAEESEIAEFRERVKFVSSLT
jgi:hypothetical protein